MGAAVGAALPIGAPLYQAERPVRPSREDSGPGRHPEQGMTPADVRPAHAEHVLARNDPRPPLRLDGVTTTDLPGSIDCIRESQDRLTSPAAALAGKQQNRIT